jgi:hypothetical protein
MWLAISAAAPPPPRRRTVAVHLVLVVDADVAAAALERRGAVSRALAVEPLAAGGQRARPVRRRSEAPAVQAGAPGSQRSQKGLRGSNNLG